VSSTDHGWSDTCMSALAARELYLREIIIFLWLAIQYVFDRAGRRAPGYWGSTLEEMIRFIVTISMLPLELGHIEMKRPHAMLYECGRMLRLST